MYRSMSGQTTVYLLKSLIIVLVLTNIDRRVICAHDCQGKLFRKVYTYMAGFTTTIYWISVCFLILCTFNSVFVDEPWPVPHIFVPRESIVEIWCTAGERSYTPFWSIDLANDTKSSFLQFTDRNNQEEQINSQSVYQLPQIETLGMPPTLRLLINDTVRNNQTMIQCDRSATTVSTTTLFVIGKVLIIIALSSCLTLLTNYCRSCSYFAYWGHCGQWYQPFMESTITRSG